MFSYNGTLNQGTTDLWDGGDVTDGVYFYKIAFSELKLSTSQTINQSLSQPLKKDGFVTVVR